jgi:hypothetical protein
MRTCGRLYVPAGGDSCGEHVRHAFPVNTRHRGYAFTRVAARASTVLAVSSPVVARTWVIVAARDHARRGLAEGFIMANHGKRAPLARMSVGDRILVYSPKTTFPDGDPFQAIAIVGTVTGTEPEPSAVIPGGFRRRADLREIEPIPLALVREHLPTSRLRFGCFELAHDSAGAVWDLLPGA